MNKGIIAQMGTPEEIYHHPNSEFVADFIGEVNCLTSKVFKVATPRTSPSTRAA